jgi:membrane-bound ClpP family serine protease
MEFWVWAILLLIVGMALVVMDVFLPSGGMFAVLAVCAIVAAVVLGFFEGSTMGFSVLTAAILGLPVVVVIALRLLPETPMGRRFLLKVPTSDEVLPENDPRQALQALVGRLGTAKCKMLPSGIVCIGDRNYDAVGEGSPIDAGQRVRVVEVRGHRLIVEAAAEEPASETAEDILSRPVDWETQEPFPPPPA